ncbi:MAG: metallophosphoesterase [bacterium]|nr:metallophosphoesterase [bacterium]
MKKLLILLTLLVLCAPTYAKNIRFIQATDVHMTQKSADYVKNFIDDINKNYSDIDFLMFSGDNINRADIRDLDLFLDIVKKAKPTVYVIPGNHDLYLQNDLGNVKYMSEVRKKLGFYHSSKPNYIFKKKGVIFITMNGVKEVIPSPNGYYRENELKWLDKKLTQYKNKKVVIIQHFPLLDTNVKGHNLYKKDQYYEVLKKHDNVIAIVAGHYHRNQEEMQDGVYHILTQQFSHGKAYKIIEIDPESGFIFTTLIEK